MPRRAACCSAWNAGAATLQLRPHLVESQHVHHTDLRQHALQAAGRAAGGRASCPCLCHGWPPGRTHLQPLTAALPVAPILGLPETGRGAG